MSACRYFIVLFLSGIVLAGCVAEQRPVKKPDEKRAELHAQLAAGYMQRNQYDVALEELKFALSIDSNNASANHVMAVLQSRLNNDDSADGYFRRAIGARKDYAQAQHDYGVFLCARGEYKEAFRWFRRVLQNPLYRNPELINLHAGECLLNQPNPDLSTAEGYIRTALKTNPKLPAALYDMARIRYGQRSYLSARAYIQRYFEAGRETPQTLLLAVKIERALRAKDAAADYARRLRRGFPKSTEASEVDIRRGK